MAELIINNRYTLLEKIGNGASGEVYRGIFSLMKGKILGTSQEVAIKFVNKFINHRKSININHLHFLTKLKF